MQDQNNPISPNDESGAAIPINIRDKVQASIRQAQQERATTDQIDTGRLAMNSDTRTDDEIVEEYEERYYGEKAKRDAFAFQIPPRHRHPSRPAPTDVSESERMWAAVAHASALLSLGLLIFSAGIGSIFTIFIPLAIYLVYREKSEFVAYHALQAFAVQVVGIVGFIVLFLGILATWVLMLIISALLILVLIGIPLIVVVALVGMVALGATFILPLAMVVYSMMAATAAWGGRNFHYPWISDWVDDQIYTRI